MKLSEIRLEMMLRHISDVGIPKQKLIVVRIRENATDTDDDDSIFCEWMSRNGDFHQVWLNPKRLTKW